METDTPFASNMSNPDMLKIAQIGFANAILPALVHPDMDVRAHCDIREKNRVDAAKIIRFIKVKMKSVKELTPFHSYTDYREMLAKEDLDIVIVSTPHRFHAEMALAALKNGCHVLVEKPMCVTVGECEQLVAAVKASGLKLAVNQNVRLAPRFHYLFDRRDAGALGQIYYVKADYIHSKDPRIEEKPGNSIHEFPPLFSFGSHPIDLILGLLDEQAETVYACGAKKRTDARFKFNDAIALTIKTPDRRIGESLTIAACIRNGFFGFELFGTKTDVVQTTNYYPQPSPSADLISTGKQDFYEKRFKPTPPLGLILTGEGGACEEKFAFTPKTLEHLDGHMGGVLSIA